MNKILNTLQDQILAHIGQILTLKQFRFISNTFLDTLTRFSKNHCRCRLELHRLQQLQQLLLQLCGQRSLRGKRLGFRDTQLRLQGHDGDRHRQAERWL